ncbi:hypothetical protein RchiOBHm_Chr3g0466771 [Rosa chinensis]|uniref:Uncharacterized protein n=1 Tax=Rosa chinensis TaxID=74649 RepID=A0A2P6RA28_ROSCH|nr:hypothetical protein RchiOBHm_Chr3g0466771 [Rosa chinensis]
MDSKQPDPKSINPSDPNRLLPEDDRIKLEISKTEDGGKKGQAGPPETSSSSSVTEESGSEKVVVEDDDNDGFRTPVNHRIPVITECPPAPKKTRIPLRKRKALNSPSASSRKRIQIMLSEEEFDALFPPPYDFRGQIKKASPDGAV